MSIPKNTPGKSPLRPASCGLILTLLNLIIPNSQATPQPARSPVLTNSAGWDCLVNGQKGQQGILFITFSTNTDANGNHTFSGHKIETCIAPPPPKTNGRNAGATNGRGGSGTSSPATNSVTVYGHSVITNGIWNYDRNGNTIGFFTESVQMATSVTNYGVMNLVTNLYAEANGVTYSNLNFEITFTGPDISTNVTLVDTNQNTIEKVFHFLNSNFTINQSTVPSVNTVSFIAQTLPNKRLTAVYSSSIAGNGFYQGIPMKGVTSLAGRWTGTEQSGGLTTYDLTTLQPLPTSEAYTNIYRVLGSGAGFNLDGTAMVSAQRRITFSAYKYSPVSGFTLRSTSGPFINTSSLLGGDTKGLEDPSANVSYSSFWVAP